MIGTISCGVERERTTIASQSKENQTVYTLAQ